MHGHKRALTWLTALLIAATLFSPLSLAAEEDIRFFLPDAQFQSNAVKAFITLDLPSESKPVLTLANVDIKEIAKSEQQDVRTITYAADQRFQHEIEGQTIGFEGTVLLFDLSRYRIPFYKAMIRFTPVLTWEEKDPATGAKTTRTAVGNRPVYLGNLSGSAGWTLIIVLSLVFFITFVSKSENGGVMHMFCGPEGRLSLSRLQVAAWTLAIGGIVLSYGMVGMSVPNIPDSLIALMGFSLATGGLNYISVDMKKGGKAQPAEAPATSLSLRQLICQYDENSGQMKPSLVKAQMLFWTGLLLVIFVVKSLLDRVMWDIPWELVALMGMSQAGYLSPKFIPQKEGSGTLPDHAPAKKSLPETAQSKAE